MKIDTPQTIIVTSNKGGSGKTPLSIALTAWALSQDPPLRVLAVDINHTNQDLFQALKDLKFTGERTFETAFSLPSVETAYYLPLSENLHLVRPREFLPLPPEHVLDLIQGATASYAKERGVEEFKPDMIVVDGNYCFPSYRLKSSTRFTIPPFIFFNIWSITSPHELRIPSAYRTTISEYKAIFDNQTWDSTHFVHVFSVLEKDRSISSEFSRLVRFQREIYTVPGSDDLAGLYKERATSPTARVEGYPFDQVQREVFSPLLAELDSLMTEDPKSYTEDVINARWIERVNVFLTKHNTFPLNVLPLPHYYPYLRKAVVDMILRRSLTLDEVRSMLGSFYTWM
ncbi:MAG: hypothetical protein ACTSXS_03245, partial [Candidatus Thorarchaeota archaeon]